MTGAAGTGSAAVGIDAWDSVIQNALHQGFARLGVNGVVGAVVLSRRPEGEPIDLDELRSVGWVRAPYPEDGRPFGDRWYQRSAARLPAAVRAPFARPGRTLGLTLQAAAAVATVLVVASLGTSLAQFAEHELEPWRYDRPMANAATTSQRFSWLQMLGLALVVGETSNGFDRLRVGDFWILDGYYWDGSVRPVLPAAEA